MRRHSIDSYELLQIWLAYTEFQSHQLEPSTLKRDYGKISKRVALMPPLSDEIAVRDWLMRRYSTETVRRMLQKFSACCGWAVRSRYLKVNPYDGLDKDFRKKANNHDRRAFTAIERDRILTAVEENRFASRYGKWKHSFYLPYFQFLFWTGCRLEEANALHWRNVSKNCDRVKFCEALPADTRILGSIKTHKIREFKCNRRLIHLLQRLDRVDSFVFLSPGGSAIDSHNVLNRTWRPVLEELVDESEIREYLPLKHCRHTFITLALEAGIEVKDVAALVGNSPDVIYRHYAAKKPDLDLPEF
ncbi:site-specific integrase [Leptolyngbya sp. NIES-2104]|uniref:site-specific integrase n=1 Tax=Leptolyngbya sp. NIES-2104 TaxID=1552121 RepID=UPI0006EC93A3|nr:tyrosine-type recombinase/integrase [Leptolyngbya sp. NIES-2104]GAP99141.1 phage integrase [Leptolyngbya sp. NIES-2104]